ncbi:prolipoprotein diacylglyceryl transferase family protein [Desulfosporosinus burensis]
MGHLNQGFGLVYPPGTPADEAYGNQPLWPAEVWEGQWDMIVFALIIILPRWLKLPRGILFITYIVLYSLGRFGLGQGMMGGGYDAKSLGVDLTNGEVTTSDQVVAITKAYTQKTNQDVVVGELHEFVNGFDNM